MGTAEQVAARELLGALFADDPQEVQRLSDRLVAGARSAGLLEVAYRTIDTPVGSLLLAATDGGVLRIGFEREGHDRVLAQLADTVSPRILLAPASLDTVAFQLDEYFTRRRRTFALDLDLRLAPGFRRSVLEHLVGIPYGGRESYAAVAAAVGNPRASRAAGTACATNPIPVVIPCHRVVRSDGSIGAYLGGQAAKSYLLDLESAVAP